MGYDAVVDSAKLNGALTATADAIRRKTDSSDPITFDMDEGFKSSVDGIASGSVDTSADTVIPEVLVKDYTAHDKDGKPIVGELDVDAVRDEGYEAGKKAEYDAFWDAYQHNGTRRQYSRGFAGEGWVIDAFKPKYDVRPTHATAMFEACNLMELDLYQYCKDSGWILDFSECIQMSSMCMYSSPYKMPTIDTRSASNLISMFSNNTSIQHIQELILRDNGDQNYSSMFALASKLHTLNIVGTIGKNGFNVSWSPLDKASLTSIVNALSATTTGLTATMRLAAVNTAFETSPGAADGSTSDEWLALAATKANWTISLINS